MNNKMNNKISKLLKYFISVVLIFGLTIPSFCAEGSVFITKKEFDDALSDFNNRLSTFEAGINAKIDSQVSTYLDRNGIWSPLKQNKNNGYMLHNFYDTNSRSYAFTKGDNGFESDTGTYVSTLDMIPKSPDLTTYTAGQLYSRIYATGDIVTKLNKAGMFHMEVSVYNLKQILGTGTCYDTRLLCSHYGSDSDKRNFVNYFWWGLKFYEEKESGEVLQRGQLKLFRPRGYPGNWKYLVFNQLVGKQQFYFFVNKNSKLYYEYVFEYIGAGSGTALPINKDYEVPGGDGSGIMTVFDVCEVY